MTQPTRRHKLLLWGFMGVGKSTVGRALAARAAVPFIDLDVAIEASAGETILELFARGEATFRTAEAETLREVLAMPQTAVVALGGGALLSEASRQLALDRGFVVTLSASLDTILARTEGSGRPLLHGEERGERARELLAERASAYRSVHAQVSTDVRDIEDIVAELLNLWRPACD